MPVKPQSGVVDVLKTSKIANLIAKFINVNHKKSAVGIAQDQEIVVEAQNLVKVLEFLKDNSAFQMQMLIGICGADYPANNKRFEVIYQLLSVTKNHRLRVVVQLNANDVVPSVTGLYKAAAWYEREIWDLYGIKFSGNDDLRRILTDYGFNGHPLRKDFPLTGFKEVRYDDESQKVVYEDVYLTQEYRNFDTLSPYEGTQPTNLPGDEKATKE